MSKSEKIHVICMLVLRPLAGQLAFPQGPAPAPGPAQGPNPKDPAPSSA